MLSLIVQVMGIYYVVINLKLVKDQLSLSKKAHQDTLLWNKKMATENELANKVDKTTVKRLKDTFKEWHDSTIPLNIILEKIKEDNSIEDDISHLLNRYERLARGVVNDYYDAEVVRDAAKGRFLRIFKRYSEYILYVQNTKNKSAWTQYQFLVYIWHADKID